MGPESDRALIVGIDSYPELEPDLKGACKDAQAMARWLESQGITGERLQVIVSPEGKNEDGIPTMHQVETVLRDWWRESLKRKEKGDGARLGRRLILYFAGHGFAVDRAGRNEPVLVTAESTAGDVGSIAALLYAECFKEAGVFDQVLVFMDTCRTALARTQARPPTFQRTKDPTNGEYLYCLAASNGQPAREIRVGKEFRGQFTHALIGGLEGKAGHGVIRVEDLRAYLYEEGRKGGWKPDFRYDPDPVMNFELTEISSQSAAPAIRSSVEGRSREQGTLVLEPDNVLVQIEATPHGIAGSATPLGRGKHQVAAGPYIVRWGLEALSERLEIEVRPHQERRIEPTWPPLDTPLGRWLDEPPDWLETLETPPEVTAQVFLPPRVVEGRLTDLERRRVETSEEALEPGWRVLRTTVEEPLLVRIRAEIEHSMVLALHPVPGRRFEVVLDDVDGLLALDFASLRTLPGTSDSRLKEEDRIRESLAVLLGKGADVEPAALETSLAHVSDPVTLLLAAALAPGEPAWWQRAREAVPEWPDVRIRSGEAVLPSPPLLRSTWRALDGRDLDTAPDPDGLAVRALLGEGGQGIWATWMPEHRRDLLRDHGQMLRPSLSVGEASAPPRESDPGSELGVPADLIGAHLELPQVRLLRRYQRICFVGATHDRLPETLALAFYQRRHEQWDSLQVYFPADSVLKAAPSRGRSSAVLLRAAARTRSALEEELPLYARSCKVKELEDLDEFLSLWHWEDGEPGEENSQITIVSWESLEGIKGVIRRVAERAIGREPDGESLRRAFSALVYDEGEHYSCRRGSWSATPEPARPHLERLVRAGLLFRDEDADSLEVIDEQLFRAWPRLSMWLDEIALELRQHRELRQAAAAWARDQTPERLQLIHRGKLGDATRIRLFNAGIPLAERERDYLDAAQAKGLQEALDKKRFDVARNPELPPTLRSALLREIEEPGYLTGWMREATSCLHERLWQSSLTTPEEWNRSFWGLTFDAAGALLSARQRPDGMPWLWWIDELGEPNRWGRYAWTGYDADLAIVFTIDRKNCLSLRTVERGADLESEGVCDNPEYRDGGIIERRQRFKDNLEAEIRPSGEKLAPVSAASEPRCGKLVTAHGATYVRWDLSARTADELSFLTGIGKASQIELSRSGRWMGIVTEPDRNAFLVDLKERRTNPLESVMVLALDPDGILCAVVDETTTLQIYQEGSPIYQSQPRQYQSNPPSAIAIHPDRSQIWLGFKDGSLEILPLSWEPDCRICKRGPGRELVREAAGIRLVRQSRPDQKPVPWRTTHEQAIYRIWFSQEGRYALTASQDGGAVLWDTEMRSDPRPIRGHKGRVLDATMSADESRLATSGAGTIRIWDTRPPRLAPRLCRASLTRTSNRVNTIVLEQDEDGLIIWGCADHDEVFRLLLPKTEKPEQWGEVAAVESLRIDNLLWRETSRIRDFSIKTDTKLRWRLLAAEGREAVVIPLRVSGALLQEPGAPFLLGGVMSELQHVSTPDDLNCVLAVSDSGEVLIWDSTQPERPRRLTIGPVAAAAIRPDGRTFVAVSSEGYLVEWDRDGREPVYEWPEKVELANLRISCAPVGPGIRIDCGGWTRVAWAGHPNLYTAESPLRFVDGGKSVVYAERGDGLVIHLSSQGGYRLKRRLNTSVHRVKTISPDASWLATQDEQGRGALLIWPLSWEKEAAALPDAVGITCVQPFPDSTRLVTGHDDGTVRIWPILLEPREVSRELWRATPYCLTVKEREQLLGENRSDAWERRQVARAKVRKIPARPIPFAP